MAEIEISIKGEEVSAALERLQRLLGGTLRVELGTNVRYAAIHQFGGVVRAKRGYLTFRIGNRWARKKQVTIPARPYMPPLPGGELNPEDAAEVAAVLNGHLSRAFDGERLTGRDAMTEIGRYLKTSTQLRFRSRRGRTAPPGNRPTAADRY